MKIRKRNADGADLSAVEVRQSDVHGRGVFSLRNLRPGEVIGHYAGRRYGPDETHPGWNDQLTYLFGLSDGSVIDDAEGGNATRHINHACIPNVEAVERRSADDELLLVVRTVRVLRAGDELFLDDALVIDGDDPADCPCACRTDACRGTTAALAAISASAL
jgi:uncharacterized protein